MCVTLLADVICILYWSGLFREIWGPRAKIYLGALPILTYSNHIFIVRYLRTKEFEKIFTSEFNINKL